MNERESRRLKVLLVEDDPALAEMYRLQLARDGYQVTVAADGETALSMVAGAVPDLALLDIRLPAMNGLDVLEELRRDDRTRNLPVVILTSYDDGEFRERATRLEALDYLVKFQTTPARLSRWIEGWAASVP
jgi:two-component system phosphate regulon response regulator PhoB